MAVDIDLRIVASTGQDSTLINDCLTIQVNVACVFDDSSSADLGQVLVELIGVNTVLVVAADL